MHDVCSLTFVEVYARPLEKTSISRERFSIFHVCFRFPCLFPFSMFHFQLSICPKRSGRKWKELKGKKRRLESYREKSVKIGEKRSSCGSGKENNLRPKRKRRENDMNSTINVDECCVCLGMYLEDLDTDRQWLECSCGRWIHEDCVDTEDVDNSKMRLCPLC